jgi:hypothetical protein
MKQNLWKSAFVRKKLLPLIKEKECELRNIKWEMKQNEWYKKNCERKLVSLKKELWELGWEFGEIV